ncbi:MAG TPA: CBS domain-containing protein [Gaiellaceae bacterium]|nr:CBS domain-containing protein [Gaiellaceae bacterium]
MTKSVRDAMTANPLSISPASSVVEAARLMRDRHVGSLPVVEDERLVGLITDRDIAVRVVAESAEPQSITVGDVASHDAVTAAPEQDLDEALRLMAHHQVRRLPVTEGDRLVGILAQADMAHEEDRQKVGEMVEVISDPSDAERRI